MSKKKRKYCPHCQDKERLIAKLEWQLSEYEYQEIKRERR